jgi:hypothetical protein
VAGEAGPAPEGLRDAVAAARGADGEAFATAFFDKLTWRGPVAEAASGFAYRQLGALDGVFGQFGASLMAPAGGKP